MKLFVPAAALHHPLQFLADPSVLLQLDAPMRSQYLLHSDDGEHRV
jgi:hypothetical protein